VERVASGVDGWGEEDAAGGFGGHGLAFDAGLLARAAFRTIDQNLRFFLATAMIFLSVLTGLDITFFSNRRSRPSPKWRITTDIYGGVRLLGRKFGK
jgi:hypothetical protein